MILDEAGAQVYDEAGNPVYDEAGPPGTGWSAARTGLPADGTAVNEPGQVTQFLVAHGITAVYTGTQVITPAGNPAAVPGLDWADLGAADLDQPFTLPAGTTAIGRVTLPLSPAGGGADVTVSLCADANSTGTPGNVLASIRIPAAWLAQLTAPDGLGNGGPLATAASNAMIAAGASSAPWTQPSVSADGSGNYATPVSSGNYTIFLGGYDTTAAVAVASVSTVAWLGGTSVSGPSTQPALPRAAYQSMAATTADTVIFAGGINGTSYLTEVWAASWAPGTGTVGAWTAQAPLPVPIVDGGMATWGTTVFAAGGGSAGGSTSATSAVWCADASGGQIQSWQSCPPLPQPVSSPYVAAVNGWLIVAGGLSAAGTALTAVWYSPITATGALPAWTAGPPLPVPAYAYSPGWNTAVSAESMTIISGPTAGGGASPLAMTLTVTADGPAPAWQAPDCLIPGVYQAGCWPGDNGAQEIACFHLTSHDSVPLVPLPLVSVPLPASGLTAGATYHLLLHQDGGDAADYVTAAMLPSALPSPALSRTAGGTWAQAGSGYAFLAGAWDQTPGGPVLHTWEDGGARVTSMICSAFSGQLLGLCEATAFAGGTTLPAVTRVAYAATRQPSGLAQLA